MMFQLVTASHAYCGVILGLGKVFASLAVAAFASWLISEQLFKCQRHS